MRRSPPTSRSWGWSRAGASFRPIPKTSRATTRCGSNPKPDQDLIRPDQDQTKTRPRLEPRPDLRHVPRPRLPAAACGAASPAPISGQIVGVGTRTRSRASAPQSISPSKAVRMDILAQLIVSGATVGMIYGVIAFGYQLTFATSKTLNFGQGEALMLGALVGLTTVNFMIGQALATPVAYLLMLPVIITFGLIQGAVVEILGVRQAIRTRSEVGWIMATIALGIIFRNLAENIWGRDALKFPSPLPEAALAIGPVRVQPMELAIVAGAVTLMLLVELFNRKTIYGKAVVATANDRDAAGLMGINTKLVITFS